MKIISTDNYGGDYPDEKVVASGIESKTFADIMCKAINDYVGENSSRFYKVEEDDYVLKPGFEP